MRFRTILSDPPWQYDNTFSGRADCAATQYPTLSIVDLCGLPVAPLAEKKLRAVPMVYMASR